MFPGLLPPIATPGHASFPSGHATQAQLVFRCLSSVLASPPPPPTPPLVVGGSLSLQEMFDRAGKELAIRIARNREIAGLHYPSDSLGGQILADKLFNNILNPAAEAASSPMPAYQRLVVLARREWA